MHLLIMMFGVGRSRPLTICWRFWMIYLLLRRNQVVRRRGRIRVRRRVGRPRVPRRKVKPSELLLLLLE